MKYAVMDATMSAAISDVYRQQCAHLLHVKIPRSGEKSQETQGVATFTCQKSADHH